MNVDGRPTLADSRGAFGNPTSDSARTCITLETTSALVVVYAPAAYNPARLGEVLDGTEATLIRILRRLACRSSAVDLSGRPLVAD